MGLGGVGGGAVLGRLRQAAGTAQASQLSGDPAAVCILQAAQAGMHGAGGAGGAGGPGSRLWTRSDWGPQSLMRLSYCIGPRFSTLSETIPKNKVVKYLEFCAKGHWWHVAAILQQGNMGCRQGGGAALRLSAGGPRPRPSETRNQLQISISPRTENSDTGRWSPPWHAHKSGAPARCRHSFSLSSHIPLGCARAHQKSQKHSGAQYSLTHSQRHPLQRHTTGTNMRLYSDTPAPHASEPGNPAGESGSFI